MKTATQTSFLFPALLAAIIVEEKERLREFTIGLDGETVVVGILRKWQYLDLMTPAKKHAEWELKPLKEYLIDRQQKRMAKRIEEKRTRLETISAAGELESITVSIEWKKSRMWGSNPTAKAKVVSNNMVERYSSGSIGGCGYDKESTAIAESVNQSNEFLKAMYLLKETAPGTNNRELFGYGAGYGILPALEGGVGVSCYPAIFQKIGFKFSNTASGKTFDVYSITKL